VQLGAHGHDTIPPGTEHGRCGNQQAVRACLIALLRHWLQSVSRRESTDRAIHHRRQPECTTQAVQRTALLTPKRNSPGRARALTRGDGVVLEAARSISSRGRRSRQPRTVPLPVLGRPGSPLDAAARRAANEQSGDLNVLTFGLRKGNGGGDFQRPPCPHGEVMRIPGGGKALDSDRSPSLRA